MSHQSLKWLSVIIALLLLVGLAAQCSVPATVVVKETVEVTVKETVVVKETVPVPAGQTLPLPQKLIWSGEGVNEMPGLDPASPQNAQSILAINLIFGGLVRLDAQLNVVPDGAESWKVSDDGKTYSFKIREGLQFADGTVVTAQDFAESINRALQPETASFGAAFQLQHVVGAQDVADAKVK